MTGWADPTSDPMADYERFLDAAWVAGASMYDDFDEQQPIPAGDNQETRTSSRANPDATTTDETEAIADDN